MQEKHKILINTLTKRMAEDLTTRCGTWHSCPHSHSDIDTRADRNRAWDMRLMFLTFCRNQSSRRSGYSGTAAAVATLDADKEDSRVQRHLLRETIGRAARNAKGHAIMYADT